MLARARCGHQVGHRIRAAAYWTQRPLRARRIAPQQSRDQGALEAARCRARQAQSRRQFGLAQAVRRVADGIEHNERLVERGRAAGMRHIGLERAPAPAYFKHARSAKPVGYRTPVPAITDTGCAATRPRMACRSGL